MVPGPGPSTFSQRRCPMRFMILVKATVDSEAGVMPGEEVFQAMADYHEALAQAADA